MSLSLNQPGAFDYVGTSIMVDLRLLPRGNDALTLPAAI
jgi:hypothetical protein